MGICGSSLNKSDAEVATQVYNAAYNGDTAVITKLHRLGADLNRPNMNGVTPAFVAAQNGHTAVITKLHRFGADLNTPDTKGATPVYIAAQNGHTAVITELHRFGADLNTPDTKGETPAYIAALKGHTAVITELHRLGADLNTPDTNGATPAYIAALKGHTAVITELHRLGADLNKPTTNGVTPVNIAAYKGDTAIITELYRLGADLNKSMTNGATPVYTAAYNGQTAIITELHRLGADLNKSMTNGETPAYIAAKKGHTAVITELCRLGANLLKGRIYGDTPISIAARTERVNIVRIIFNHLLSSAEAATSENVALSDEVLLLLAENIPALVANQLLTNQNIETLQLKKQLYRTGIRIAFSRLERAGHLNQMVLNDVMSRDSLLVDDAVFSFWDLIPDSLLTHKYWPIIMTLWDAADHRQGFWAFITKHVGVLNMSQSTHARSIHESTSTLASRLRKDYDEKMSDVTLVDQLIDYVNPHAEGCLCDNAISLSGVHYILDVDNHFIDPVSGITLKEIMELTFLALTSEESLVDKPTALALFKEALVECMTGGRISPIICSSGMFNKFLEKLTGAYPNCELRVVTPEVANFALKARANDAVVRWAQARLDVNESSITRIYRLTRFVSLLMDIEKNGLSSDLWLRLMPVVAQQLWEEFAELFPGKESPEFVAFIDAGQYILPKLGFFKQKVAASEAYREYCSAVIATQLPNGLV